MLIFIGGGGGGGGGGSGSGSSSSRSSSSGSSSSSSSSSTSSSVVVVVVVVVVDLAPPVHLVPPFITTTYTFVPSRPLVMSSFFCLSHACTCTCVLTLAVSAPPRGSVCVPLEITGIRSDCAVFSFSAGGPSTCCERWSNEAATVHADIWPDQPDVPAVITTYFLMGPFVTRTSRWPLHRF